VKQERSKLSVCDWDSRGTGKGEVWSRLEPFFSPSQTTTMAGHRGLARGGELLVEQRLKQEMNILVVALLEQARIRGVGDIQRHDCRSVVNASGRSLCRDAWIVVLPPGVERRSVAFSESFHRRHRRRR
jgi:hypothetical protein